MGSPRVCYKESAYRTALNKAEEFGFDVEADKASVITGNGNCEGDKFIYVKSNPGSECNENPGSCWISPSGKAFLASKFDSLPDGIKAVLGLEVKGSTATETLKYNAIAGYYACAAANTKLENCYKKVDEKAEKGLATIEKKQTIKKNIDLADKMVARAAKIVKAAKELAKANQLSGNAASELQDMLTNFIAFKPTKIDTVEKSKHYLDAAQELLDSMLRDDAAIATIKEKGQQLNCKVQTVKTAAPPAKQGYKALGGEYMSVQCYNIEGFDGVAIDLVRPSYEKIDDVKGKAKKKKLEKLPVD